MALQVLKALALSVVFLGIAQGLGQLIEAVSDWLFETINEEQNEE